MLIDDKVPLGPEKAVKLIRQWASLATEDAEELRPAGWTAMQIFVEAAKPKLEAAERQLSQMLSESDARLAPLSDPLRLDFSLHRWLKKAREEEYSDWLAWTLGQLGSLEAVLNALDATTVSSLFTDPQAITEVSREEWVQLDGWRHWRRLDLVVRCQGAVVAVIEVKVVKPEQGDLEKNKYYWDWKQSKNEHAVAILLALDGDSDICNPFRLLTWTRLCVLLRKLLPRIQKEKGLAIAALVSAFVGAVEENLLGFSICSPSSLLLEHINASIQV